MRSPESLPCPRNRNQPHADELGRVIADGQIADCGQQRPRRCAERPDRSERRLLARGGQAGPEGIQGRRPAGPCGGADLLRHPVDLPGSSCPGLPARHSRQVGHPAAHHQPGQGGSVVRAEDHHERCHPSAAQPCSLRDPRHRRNRARAVVGVQLRRGLHACLQRHLRRARGPADLEDRADPPGRHRGDDDLARGGGRHRGRDRRPGAEGRERARRSARQRSPSGTSPSGRCC